MSTISHTYILWYGNNIQSFFKNNNDFLTSGTKGGSTMPASRRFQLMQLKNWCNLTSRAPCRPFRQPSRDLTVFDSSCWHSDFASSLNLCEYFSASSWNTRPPQQDDCQYYCVDAQTSQWLTLTRRSTSSRFTFSLRSRNGAWPSIISYSRHPKLNQSGENEYFSLSITSGAM